ncbi:hypothetical protein [Limnovirga soli]|uniref:Uncharacterized protein n=1 Tax=Limnovirga soli TaxID=2656915 RepID=A0A8J8JZ20_9BACT|nr:hypothetical protein [Limnovirga soli]NNV57891.1 hypothetical protein [Limnovirga soli]
MNRFLKLIFTTGLMVLMGCAKQSATVQFPALSDYLPLQTGRVLVYRLDSSLIPLDGSDLVVKSYHAKDSIADTITDGMGRLTYRMYRFVTDTLETQPWQNIGTFLITANAQTVELLDDKNRRFVILTQPLRDGFTWPGNAYIDTKSATSPFQFMDGWRYQYTQFNQPITLDDALLDSTITVLQRDEISPPGPFEPQNYQQRNYAVEIYAKGIGLVYKEFLHSTWQPTPPPAKYDNDSYGIKLSLIAIR